MPEMSKDPEVAALREELQRISELAKLSIWECDLSRVMSELKRHPDASERLDRNARYVQEVAGLMRIVEVNAEALRTFGAPTRELLNECLQELVREEAVALFRTIFKGLCAGEHHVR